MYHGLRKNGSVHLKIICYAVVLKKNRITLIAESIKNMDFGLILIGAIMIMLIAGIFLSVIVDDAHQTIDQKSTVRVPDYEFLFMSDFHNQIDAYSDVFEKLDLISWDVIVSGGGMVQDGDADNDEVWDAVGSISDDVIPLRGFSDFNDVSDRAKDMNGYMNVGQVQVIFLDTLGSKDKAACSFSSDQVDLLREAVAEEASYRILYTSLPWWDEELMLGYCPEGSGYSDTESIIRDSVDIAVGGGAEFKVEEADNIRFVTSQISAEPESKYFTMARIALIGDELNISPVSLANINGVDVDVLRSLPTYRVTVDKKELEHVYDSLPNYDVLEYLSWVGKLENVEDMKYEIPGSCLYEGNTYAISLETRGSFGNHWEGLKKSWSLNITSADGIEGRHQLKFVIPSDRLYVNQLFVQEINRDENLDILSPEISIGRLVINNIDFGPYLMYEDFDEVFVELRQFSPDVSLASNLFRDLFGLYPLFDDLNYSEVSSRKEDKSDYQNLLLFPEGYEQFKNYLDPVNYRSWIASQIFTNDPHQNANNNMRLFLDRSTGRYVLLSWDQFLRAMESEEDIFTFHPNSTIQLEILDNEEEKKEIMKIVRKLWDNRSEHRTELLELIDRTQPVFLNDPFPLQTQDDIRRMIGECVTRYDTNMEVFDGYFNE